MGGDQAPGEREVGHAATGVRGVAALSDEDPGVAEPAAWAGRRCGTGFLLRGLEDGQGDVFHVPDHAGNQKKEKHEHHDADGEAHLHPVSLLFSHHADNLAPAELAF